MSMLNDGVYGLSFESRVPGGGDTERSDGLAILRGGQILGSDRHGGVFRGHYRYDDAEGCAVIELRLAVPPHGVLVTGLAAGPGGAFVDVAGRFQPPRPMSSAVVDIGGALVAVELRFVGPLAA